METTTQPLESPGTIRRRGWLLSVAAIAIALIAGIGHFAYLNDLEREIGHRISVVVAAEPIPARTVITAEMLKVVEMPEAFLPEAPNRPFLDMSELLDGNTTALIDITPDQPIQQNMVSGNLVEPGQRAVSIAIDPVTSTGNSVRPGNYVDVVRSFVDDQDCAVSEFLLQNVRVLAVNTDVLAPDLAGGLPYLPDSTEGEVELVPSMIVTLELDQADTLKLVHADNFATELRLIIRRVDDSGEPNIVPVQDDVCAESAATTSR
jgi:pilus assembly protein CpaB